jgi:hypothetical protein
LKECAAEWISRRHVLFTRDQKPEHWSVMVIDTVGFGRRTNQDQIAARIVLHKTVRAAFRDAGIGRARLIIQDRGDGMIVLVPAAVSKVCLLDPLIPSLTKALRRHNAVMTTNERLRVKVSLHAGEIHRDSRGWVGADLNLACRLVNSEPVYQQLQRRPEADLVLIVSDLIAHSIIRHAYRHIDPASYTPTRITAKEVVDAWAWLHVPGPETCVPPRPALKLLRSRAAQNALPTQASSM